MCIFFKSRSYGTTPYHFPRHLYSSFAPFSPLLYLSLSISLEPSFSTFPHHINVPSYFPLNCPPYPPWHWSAFAFLVAVVTPGYVLPSKELELAPSDERTCDIHLSLSERSHWIWSFLVPSIYLQSLWFHFINLNNIPQCICTTLLLSIYQLKDISFFNHFLTIVSRARVIIAEEIDLWSRISIPLGRYHLTDSFFGGVRG